MCVMFISLKVKTSRYCPARYVNNPLGMVVFLLTKVHFFYSTTESTRLRESTIRKSLDEKKTKEKLSEKEQRRKQRRMRKLQPEVSRKALANDNSWQLKRTADVKIKSYR